MNTRMSHRLGISNKLTSLLLCLLLLLTTVPATHANVPVSNTPTSAAVLHPFGRSFTGRRGSFGMRPDFVADQPAQPSFASATPAGGILTTAAARTATTTTNVLTTARANHTTTLLQNGMVLIVGGTGANGVLSSTELYDPSNGAVRTMTPGIPRAEHSATLLTTGLVLLVGGIDGKGGVLADATLYNPSTGQWLPNNKNAEPTARARHTATLLTNGLVLIAGGITAGNTVTGSAELYDPINKTWNILRPMMPRVGHTATALPNGKILVVGGNDQNGVPLTSAELYDPSGTWSRPRSLATARTGHTATLLPNGKVLVIGGTGQNGIPLANAEIYDPVSDTWSNAGTLTTARTGHTASLLPNGTLLVAGGIRTAGAALTSIELYDFTNGTWSSAATTLVVARGKHTATLLPGGELLFIGGNNGSNNVLGSIERYSTNSGQWSLTGSMITSRDGPTMTPLSNGKVLVAGGYSDGQGILASTEIFTNGQWLKTTPDLHTSRYGHTATLLQDGRVLVVGGETPYSGVIYTKNTEIYDPATQIWSIASQMPTRREWHSATLLQDGRVLVVGGNDNDGNLLSYGEIYNPANDTWIKTSNMITLRTGVFVITLQDGRVFVSGGTDTNANALNSAEIYNLTNDTWTRTSTNMAVDRDGSTQTLLPDGKVLIVGGYSTVLGNHITEKGDLASAELYDPSTDVFTSAGSLSTARFSHNAVALPNGDVLIVGGINYNGSVTSTELYQFSSGQWITLASPDFARNQNTATVLLDGNVLLAGGLGTTPGPYMSTDIYNSASKLWQSTPSMSIGRFGHTATRLLDGSVLVVGGSNGGTPARAELYDPETGQWTPTGSMNVPRHFHTTTLLTDGRVLVTGGASDLPYIAYTSAEIYDPSTGQWTFTGSMSFKRFAHTATLLADGTVLVAGGGDGYGAVLSSAEIFNPQNGRWTSVTPLLAGPRFFHSATLLQNGNVLVAGGEGSTDFPTTAELYDLRTNQWRNAGSLGSPSPARFFTATLLPTGQVLVAGGRSSNGRSLDKAVLYNPVTNNWTPTSNLNLARDDHTATLLSNGMVLVSGGTSTIDYTKTLTAELYNPATGQWTNTTAFKSFRRGHKATLLSNGKILIAGGNDNDTRYSTAELFDSGLHFNAAWQPQITNITPTVAQGGVIKVNGSGFRGVGDTASGTTQNSATDYPLLQLHSLANEQTIWVPPDLSKPWSSTSFTALPLSTFPPGYAFATIVVNGIPSESRLINVGTAIISLDSGLNANTEVWGFENPAGVPSFDQFAADYGLPSPTRLVTETHQLDPIRATNGISLPIPLVPDNLDAVLPLDDMTQLNNGTVKIPDLKDWLYYEVIVKAIYDDENTRYYNGALKSGLCAGMAATAADFHRSGSTPPPPALSNFGASIVRDIPDSVKARELIQKYHGRQISAQVVDWLAQDAPHGGRYADPGQYLSHLATRITASDWWESPEIIGIVQGSTCEEVQVGHALLPYKIVQDGPEQSRIYVYDPNYPALSTGNADSHFITVSLNPTTRQWSWSYQLAPNTVWAGQTIFSMPVSLFYDDHPKLPAEPDPVPPPASTLRQGGMLFVNGGNDRSWGGQRGAWGGQRGAWGEVKTADGTIQQTGCIGGPNDLDFVREISNSYRLIRFNGPRSNDPAKNAAGMPETVFIPNESIPHGTNAGVTFVSKGGTYTDMMIFGQRSVVGYLGTAHNETDTQQATEDRLTVDPTVQSVSLRTSDTALDKKIGIYTLQEVNSPTGGPSETRVYAVSNLDATETIHAGDALTMTVSPDFNRVTILNSSAQTQTLSISLGIFGEDKAGSISYPVIISPHTGLIVAPANWTSLPTSPVQVMPTDIGGHPLTLYLPVVTR